MFCWCVLARLVVPQRKENQYFGARVESEANPSDVPTRDLGSSLEIIGELRAIWHDPIMPSWIHDCWDVPGRLVSDYIPAFAFDGVVECDWQNKKMHM